MFLFNLWDTLWGMFTSAFVNIPVINPLSVVYLVMNYFLQLGAAFFGNTNA